MKTKLLVVVSLCLLTMVAASTASAQVSCAGVPAFANCTAYASGASVTFNGSKYTAIAPIAANRDCPPNSPFNPSTDNWWTNNGTCSSATATPTTATATPTTVRATATATTARATATATTARATATATTGATATRTNTATATRTATPSPTSSGPACAAAWAAGTAYNGGTTVSRTCNGASSNYTSAFWTQGNDPCTSSGAAGSGQPWGPPSACGGGGGTATPTNATPTPTSGGTATPTTATATPTNATATPTGVGGGQRHRAGYFEQWGIYARGCTIPGGCVPAGLETLYYAFNNPNGGSGKAQFGVNQAGVGDQWADYGQPQNGEAYNAPLKGNFHSLQLKRPLSASTHNYLSVGGWTWSDGFYAARGDSGTAMVNSYVDAIVAGNITKASDGTGGPGTLANTFDGIDLDWEYPGVCGNNPSCGAASTDKGLYTSIVQKFATALHPSGKKITAAVAAGVDKLPFYDIPALCAALDEVHIMTYDYFGAWAPTGPTAPHSPLFQFAGQASKAAPENDYYTDKSVQLWVNGGCSRSKIMIGIGSYSRQWQGTFTGNGLNQPATGPAAGTYEAGIEDYDVISSKCPSNNGAAYPSTATAGTAWCSTSSMWSSYDTPATVKGKVQYSVDQGLRGTFLWAFSGDTGSAIYNAMQ